MFTLRSWCFLTALCGIVLLGGRLGAGLLTHGCKVERPSPDVVHQSSSSTDTPTARSSPDAGSSFSESETDEDSALENVLEVLILGPIITILLGLLLAFPTVLLAVSLVMDGGCLRYILFGLGWLCAVIYGLLTGAVVGEAILGFEFLAAPIAYVFIWGYPIAAYWGYKTFRAMPADQYHAWDQILSGGALLGFGAGSVVGLARSVASGFGGFGGGSFGGGGASGSWTGATSAAGSVSSATGAGTSAATVGARGTSQAVVMAGAAAGGSDDGSSSTSSEAGGVWVRLRRWFQKFQWYHGFAFVLVTLVFVPLGLGAMRILENTTVFVGVLVCVLAYTGYKFLHRTPDGSDSAPPPIASFRGGGAASSWS